MTNEPEGYEMIGERVGIFRRGRIWYANYQHQGRQSRKSLKTASKKEARRKGLLLEAGLLEGRHQPELKAPEIDSAVATYMTYLRTERRAKKTLGKYQKVFERVCDLVRERGHKSLLNVDTRFVDAYREKRVEAGAAPKTLYCETVIIRQLINFFLSRGVLAADPLKGLKIKEPKPRRQPCWSVADVERILAASQGQQRLVFMVLADTGLRISELCFLCWEDVNFEHGMLIVRPKGDWQPKTGDQCSVPMSPRLKQLLEGLPRRGPWVFLAPCSRRYPQGGKQISPRRLLVGLKRVLARLVLDGHLHTFRHAFISASLASGIPESLVRNWVGHVDPETIKLYTHVADSQSHAAMQRLTEAKQASQLPPDKDVKNAVS